MTELGSAWEKVASATGTPRAQGAQVDMGALPKAMVVTSSAARCSWGLGVEFESAWSRRVTVDIDGVPISFISRDDLISNKLAVGRPQDLRDVRALQRVAAAGPRGPVAAPRGRAKATAKPRKR